MQQHTNHLLGNYCPDPFDPPQSGIKPDRRLDSIQIGRLEMELLSQNKDLIVAVRPVRSFIQSRC